MPVAPVRWNFWNSGRPALPAPITCPAFASMIWLMSRCRVPTYPACPVNPPGSSDCTVKLNEWMYPRFGLSGSARALTFNGTGMTPLLTSGTGIAGMPSRSRLVGSERARLRKAEVDRRRIVAEQIAHERERIRIVVDAVSAAQDDGVGQTIGQAEPRRDIARHPCRSRNRPGSSRRRRSASGWCRRRSAPCRASCAMPTGK